MINKSDKININDLKPPKVGNCFVKTENGKTKFKFYYNETEEEKIKLQKIKNIIKKTDDF